MLDANREEAYLPLVEGHHRVGNNEVVEDVDGDDHMDDAYNRREHVLLAVPPDDEGLLLLEMREMAVYYYHYYH